MVCSNSKWETICTIPFTSTQDTKIRWFQFSLMHRMLATNVYLSEIKITSDKLCTFCKQHDETIGHLFCKCQSVRPLWAKFVFWLLEKNGTRDFVDAIKCSIWSPYKCKINTKYNHFLY
jgi:hypothetical protein